MPGKSFNIVLFGDRTKTSIAYQFVHGTQPDPSVESIVIHKNVTIQDKEAQIQFVCTGSSYQESTLKKWTTHGSGIVLVYSVSRLESYNDICKTLAHLNLTAEHIPVLLLGCFNDGEIREVPVKSALETGEIYSCMIAEVSENSGKNITETFNKFIEQIQLDRQPVKSTSMPSLSSSSYPIPPRSRSQSSPLSRSNSSVSASDNWASIKAPPKEWSDVESIESADIFDFAGKSDGYHFECGGTFRLVEEDIKLEFHDKYTSYYNLMYYGKEHFNYVGISERVGNVLVSFESTDKYNSNRVLVRTKKGDTRVLVPPGITSHKDVVKHVKSTIMDISEVKLKRINNTPSVDDLFSDFENKEKITHYKFGVLYVKDGQTTEDEIYSNTTTSPDFDEFLNVLGTKIELAGFTGNGEGLDTKYGTTGKYSVHTTYEGYDIMYHVAPFLPFQEHDPQRVERKRHLGNDVVLIVFKEGNTPFDPKCIRSHFNHIFVVVQVHSKTPEKTLYRVGVATKGGVEPFGPHLPLDGIFESNELFRNFLLTKIINGERASMNGGEFRSTLVRTRNDMLAELTAKVARKKRTASGSFLRVSATNLLQALRSDKDERRKSLPVFNFGVGVTTIRFSLIPNYFKLMEKWVKYPKDSHLRQYWIWKYLQANPNDNSFALELEKTKSSCISTGISKIFCSVKESEDLDREIDVKRYLTSTGTLAWDFFCKSNLISSVNYDQLHQDLETAESTISDPEELATEKTRINEETLFLAASVPMKGAFSAIHKHFLSLTVQDFVALYGCYFDIVSYEQNFSSLFSLFRTPVAGHDSVSALVCVQIITSYLERFLGDLYVTVKQKTIKDEEIECPRMLKDLLVTPELFDTLGEDFIFMLRLMIGPPTGYNVRNIAWHGFLDPLNEFSCSYTPFIFVLLMSLAQKVKELGVPFIKRTQRNLTVPVELFDFGLGPYVFPELVKEILSIMENSLFVFHNRQYLVQYALEQYNLGDSGEYNGYHRAITALLPVLEHSLRRIYVAVNELPESTLRAESRVHYTTLDLFLSKYLEGTNTNINASALATSDLTLNKTKDEVGLNPFEALLDLFVHGEGPRLRDRVSHCEILTSSVSRIHFDRVFGVFLYLSCKYLFVPQKHSEAVQKCIEFYSQYESCFHPRTLLYKEILQCHQVYKQFQTLIDTTIHEEVDEMNEKSWIYKKRNETVEEELLLNTLMETIETNFVNKMKIESLFSLEKSESYQYSKGFSTIYLSAEELSKILVLRKQNRMCVTMAEKFYSRIIEFRNDVLNETASKRQEASLYKLLASISYFSKMLVMFMTITEHGMRDLGSFDVKYLNNCFVNTEKLVMKLNENQWALMVQLFSKFVVSLQAPPKQQKKKS